MKNFYWGLKPRPRLFVVCLKQILGISGCLSEILIWLGRFPKLSWKCKTYFHTFACMVFSKFTCNSGCSKYHHVGSLVKPGLSKNSKQVNQNHSGSYLCNYILK